MVERFHRVFKAALKAQNDPKNWYSNYGWVMLGIRSSLHADQPHSPAEMLYGSCLRLPGECFLAPSPLPTNNEYLNQLKTFVNNLQSIKARDMTSRRT